MTLKFFKYFWSERRDSNSQPLPWEGNALPLSHFRKMHNIYNILVAFLCQAIILFYNVFKSPIVGNSKEFSTMVSLCKFLSCSTPISWPIDILLYNFISLW